MVWWTDSNRYCFCRSRFFHYATSVKIINDRIFQTTNVMYNLNNQKYDAYDIHSLTMSGVNMFNVDLTVCDEDFFKKIKEVIVASERLPEMYPEKYSKSIGLALTLSITNAVDIDGRVDTVILKDVKTLKDLLEFKRKMKNCLPIMLWIKSVFSEDLKSMIQFSDGVFLDATDITETEEFDVIYLCKQSYKSVFCVINDIIEDYHLLPSNDLHFLAIANKIIAHQFDGVMVFGRDNDHKNESESVKSLVRAIDVADNETNYNSNAFKLSFNIKTPVLPWISTSLAASLAATNCGAGAIVVLTTSGTSARWIAHASPPCHVLAVTTREDTARRLHVHRKVIPLFYKQISYISWSQDCWKRIVFATTVAVETGLCTPGAKVVILAPSAENIRHCNSLQIVSLPVKCVNAQNLNTAPKNIADIK